MSKQAKFEDIVRSALARFREPVEARMRELLGRDLPPDVRVLWFEISSDTWGLPVQIFGMDEEAVNEVVIEKPPGSNSYWSVLSERLIAGRDEEYISQKAIYAGSYETAAKVIAEFVRDGYLAAGGKDHPLRAFAAHHDRGTALDLKLGKWVDTEDIHSGLA
jgi:hypothetical protein